MQTFVYPIALKTATDGGFVVSCRDLPEVITEADTRQTAVEAAEGALLDTHVILQCNISKRSGSLKPCQRQPNYS